MENQVENVPQVTLGEAKKIISALAATQSVLLLSSPGVGKSAVVRQAADEAGLECRSLLGTQIAPEDVSGIPRIIGERSVFCPPRVLLPEDPGAKPFCLFLDELPACTPDIQKAFYSLLLERRVGEYPLPKGTWVVAAGNRAEDRSLVRSLSAALVNRVTILYVKVSVPEWLKWASSAQIRHDVLSYIVYAPHSLQRAVPEKPTPFSTPRAWESLARSLDCLERAGGLTPAARKALAFGTVSPEDAAAPAALVRVHPPSGPDSDGFEGRRPRGKVLCVGHDPPRGARRACRGACRRRKTDAGRGERVSLGPAKGRPDRAPARPGAEVGGAWRRRGARQYV